jgi:hypothetical protein
MSQGQEDPVQGVTTLAVGLDPLVQKAEGILEPAGAKKQNRHQ